MILWPSVLPQNISGYGGSPGDGLIRTPMEVGPAKVRRRVTAVIEPVSGYIIVTPAQFEFFRYWHDNVLLNGSLRFGWVHPFSSLSLTNLLANGGIDINATGWTPVDGTLASVAGGIWSNCLQITRSAGSIQQASQTLTLTPGNTYNLAGYIKTGSSGDEAYELQAWDYDNSETLALLTGTSSDTWVHIYGSLIPIGTTVTFLASKYSGTAGTMLFDEISVVDITTGIAEMRFAEVPRYSGHGARIRIDMKLEILP